jgi:glucose dehydrogenase
VIGHIVAMDMRTNTKVWDKAFPVGDPCYSGMMSTAGGLVFVGRNDRTLEAYDAKTGARLWKSPKLAAGVAAPPVTYKVNGKQYVAVYAGGNGLGASFGKVKAYYGSDLYTFAIP